MLHDPAVCKLGKGPAKQGKLRLAAYLSSELPPAPPAVDWTKGITDWGTMLNDRLGDCTIAALGHAVQTWTANQGVERTISDDDIESYYSLWCNYVPGNPATDNGGVIVDVLTAWKKGGFGGVILDGFADPDPGNVEHVKQAVQIFGGLNIGLQLPVEWQEAEIWDAAGPPGTWGGHSVWVPAYNPTGPVCVTWGQLKQITWTGWHDYTDEAHCLISPVWMNKEGDAACGLDYEELKTDIPAITQPIDIGLFTNTLLTEAKKRLIFPALKHRFSHSSNGYYV